MLATSDVRYWHLAHFAACKLMSAIGGKADMAKTAAMSPNDPKRTSSSVLWCSSEARFSLYQSAHLNRYDGAS